MTDVLTLEAYGVFDDFKALAKAEEPVIEDVPPGAVGKPMPVVPPLLQSRDTPVYRALFDIDFSKTGSQLVNEFKEWLNLPKNRERLEDHRKVTQSEWRAIQAELKEIESRAVRMPDGTLACTPADICRRAELGKKQLRTDPIENAKARLKDLAAWRLYREESHSVARTEGLKGEEKISKLEAANRFANTHRR
jgi:hypothetical protein